MKLLTEKDDASINDQSTIYSKKMTRAGRNQSSGIPSHKFTKQNLMPAKNQYHSISTLNNFLSSKYDHYTREYTEFFLKQLTKFEEKIEEHRREIALNALSEKRTGASSTVVTSIAPPSDDDTSTKKTAEQLQKEEDEQKKALEARKFPSFAYLRKMGVNNFKPSIHHKVQSGHKVFNILNDPLIAQIEHQVDCQWEGGVVPKFNKSAAAAQRKIRDFDTDQEVKKVSVNLFKFTPKKESSNKIILGKLTTGDFTPRSTNTNRHKL